MPYPPTIPQRVAVPTFEPIELADARRQCGIAPDLGHEDHILLPLIQTARETVERDALLICCTGSYTIKRTDFGCGEWFELPSNLRPVTAVTAITYVDSAGATQTWSASEYSLDTYSIAPLVRLNYDYVWPTIRGDFNGITITATVGYATALTVPARVKQACLLLVNHWYENRGLVGQVGSEIAMSYESLIDGLRREVYA